MSNVHRLAPATLTINRRFIADLWQQQAPCFALSMIEDRGRLFAALVLKPGRELPPASAEDGFELGHSVLGDADHEVIHFAFEFAGVGTYNVLLNPSNAQVQAVVRSMVERGGYFIVWLAPRQEVTLFQSGFGHDDLQGLRDHLARLERSTTSEQRYRQTEAQFRRQPTPPGTMLTWVCRDEPQYLRPAVGALELSRSDDEVMDSAKSRDSPRSPSAEPPPHWQPLSMLPTIRMIVETELESNERLLALLKSAHGRRNLLDAATLARIVALCTSQSAFVPVQREQLARWRLAVPSMAQRQEIQCLAERVERHAEVALELLALAREFQGTSFTHPR